MKEMRFFKAIDKEGNLSRLTIENSKGGRGLVEFVGIWKSWETYPLMSLGECIDITNLNYAEITQEEFNNLLKENL